MPRKIKVEGEKVEKRVALKKGAPKSKVKKTRDIQVVLIAGPKKMDTLMHAFDVFEESKRLGVARRYEITFPEDISNEQILSSLRSLEEADGENYVLAAFIPGVKEGAYRDERVRSISDGHKWASFSSMLKAYGFVE